MHSLYVFGEDACWYTQNVKKKLTDQGIPFHYCTVSNQNHENSQVITQISELTAKRTMPIMLLLRRRRSGRYSRVRWTDPQNSDEMAKQAIQLMGSMGPFVD
jgi:glutaredoxin